VFEVYPWAALLRAGRPPAPAVRVLDRCRVRVGEVLAVTGETATVTSRPLTWDGRHLVEGPALVEQARWSQDGGSLIDVPVVGDTVALHWDWVCEVLSADRAAGVVARERGQLEALGLSPGGR
ncbi:MAG: DUF6390 family protein, partial [Nocardioidaceae bacterium]